MWVDQCQTTYILSKCHANLQDHPEQAYSKLATQFPYNTRLAQTDSVRMGPSFQSKLDLTKKSSMNRATISYNYLPKELRAVSKIETFKTKLKQWVKENIEF